MNSPHRKERAPDRDRGRSPNDGGGRAIEEEDAAEAFAAAARGDVGRLSQLIDRGLPLDARHPDWGRDSLLSLCCLLGRRRTAAFLIRAGAPVNVDTDYWTAPLCRAAQGGHFRLVRSLARRGAAIDHPPGAYTPLMAACEHGSVHCLNLLLSLGARADAATRSGRTALSMAAESSHAALTVSARRAAVSALLAAGADPARRDEDGRSAIDWARSRGDEGLVRLLLQADSRDGSSRESATNGRPGRDGGGE